MLSRRTVVQALAATGTAGLSGLAGCSALESGVPGYVQLKSIGGVSSSGGTRTEETVLRVSLASPPGDGPPEVVQYSDEWLARFEDRRKPVVSNALHDELRQAYDEVRYVVGVCSREWADDDEPVGCYNVATTRENYNQVQVHQGVRASSNGTALTIHSTEGEWAFESDGSAN